MSRLDVHLVQHQLAQSRQRAVNLIKAGKVSVNGKVFTKPALEIQPGDEVTLSEQDMVYVGRGALKLEYALSHWNLKLQGLHCLDIGASTGGFTDCMLRQGAEHVYAVDVGHGQLAGNLCTNPQVTNLEGTDIRTVTVETLGEQVDFISGDVSFISLNLVLPVAEKLLKEQGQMVMLIKPQFEAGRSALNKNGLVKNPKDHVRVLLELQGLFQQCGLSLQGLCGSPIAGGSGNHEYLALLEKSQRASIVPDVIHIVDETLKK